MSIGAPDLSPVHSQTASSGLCISSHRVLQVAAFVTVLHPSRMNALPSTHADFLTARQGTVPFSSDFLLRPSCFSLRSLSSRRLPTMEAQPVATPLVDPEKKLRTNPHFPRRRARRCRLFHGIPLPFMVGSTA